MNLVDVEAKPAQAVLLEIARTRLEESLSGIRHLRMPAHHDVRAGDVDLKRLGAVLAVAYERDLHDFAELLLLEKFGPRTLQSLALVAEVVHGAPSRFTDPARFSFAHGGKDRHPFPVPLKTYDESLNVLRTALDRAKIGIRTATGDRVSDGEKLEGFRRLERFVRAVETSREPKADFDAVIAHENEISASLDGRSVFDDPLRRRNLTLATDGNLVSIPAPTRDSNDFSSLRRRHRNYFSHYPPRGLGDRCSRRKLPASDVSS